MPKRIITGAQAREKIVSGTNQIADAVGSTLGPKGQNVGIGGFWTDPVVLHDGVSVAKKIELEDKAEDFAAQLIRQAADKTNTKSGDGTTSTTILTQAMVIGGTSFVNQGANSMSLKKGMEIAKDIILDKIKEATIQVETKDEIEQVARISAQDPEIGKMIAKAVWKVGRNGTVDVQESSKYGIEFEIKEGMEFEKGLTSPQFATNDKGSAELENVLILLLDHPISSAEKLMEFLMKVSDERKEPFSILIMADNIDQHSLKSLLTNKEHGALFPLFIQSPGFAERRKEYIGDIAALTGATVVARDLGMNLDNIDITVLGEAEKVTSDSKDTKIVGGRGDKKAVELRVKSIEKQIENSESEYDKKVHQERIAKLTSGCAIIKVGGFTEVEMKDNIERVIDASEATKAAFKHGIVYGGGRLLWEISDYLDENPPEISGDIRKGYDLVSTALKSPFFKLMSNSGFSLESMEDFEFENGFGINAETGELVDLIKAGIIDPAEVVLNTVQNSVSVASMLITTNTIIVDIENPKEREEKLNL